MSVGAFITNPVNEAERVFYLPILTEQPFREFLRPLAEKHDLRGSRREALEPAVRRASSPFTERPGVELFVG